MPICPITLPHFRADDCGKVQLSGLMPRLVSLKAPNAVTNIGHATRSRRQPCVALHPSTPVGVAFGLVTLPATGNQICDLSDVAGRLRPRVGGMTGFEPAASKATTWRTAGSRQVDGRQLNGPRAAEDRDR